mmetsp:Transcript_22204/g.31083  ORF Transcript_22204/g.31083 Transcript_22204/m.31083 type:complete len:84 (-) Transcript_22204:220-471(-)
MAMEKIAFTIQVDIPARQDGNDYYIRFPSGDGMASPLPAFIFFMISEFKIFDNEWCSSPSAHPKYDEHLSFKYVKPPLIVVEA